MTSNPNDLIRAFKVIEQLEGELDALKRAQIEPIAIVGMACRFPGADGLDAYWSLLSEGRDAVTEVPPERWDIDALYSPDADAPGKLTTRRGGFIDGVDRFDAAFFNISPREATLMDPQQRLALEMAWAALEHAGIAPDALEGSDTGVFAGVSFSDYSRLAAANIDNLNAYWGTGNVPSVVAGRIAYTLGLQGPCLSIDTACSSALVAVHEAVESLRRRECHAALAVSTNLLLAPEATIAFSKARMMSPDGRCQSFDERANGYVRSEGAAALVLKTLSQARADDDRIHAVIRGSAINQDGASSGLTVPNGPAQTALIRRAIANAGLRPQDIGYIEAHGTGTALGDPIEVGALGEVFGSSHSHAQPLYLGSVKSLIGHLEITAGMAGLIKLVLALQHALIPGYPQLGKLNPHVPWQRLPFEIARAATPWPVERRIGGVSSFGFSGTNAHVIVEAAANVDVDVIVDANTNAARQPAYLLCLSARSEAALLTVAKRYAAHLSSDVANADAAADAVCHVAATGRAHLPYRIALVGTDTAEFASALAHVDADTFTQRGGVCPPDAPMLAFSFSGQGAQYPGMGQALYALHPVFREAIDRCEAAFASELDVPLRELMWHSEANRLAQTRYTQPVLFAFEYALAQLWRSWGVQPSFVVGHSIGEFAAACLAGVFSVEDGARLVAARGRLMQALPPGGAMAALTAPRELVVPLVAADAERVSIAAFNSPTQTVVSGHADAVQAIARQLRETHDIAEPMLLDVSHAFHSPLMRPMLDAFRRVAESVSYAPAQLGFVSTVTGTLALERVSTADYWVEHILAPVDFMSGIADLASRGVTVALEVGPGSTLSALARASLPPGTMRTLASVRRGADDWRELLAALSQLYVAGAAIDWNRAGRIDQPRPARAVLPGYPFERRRYWLPETGSGAVVAHAVPSAHAIHPLLGAPLPAAALGPGDALFQASLSARHPAWLRDHRVYGKVVVPGAAYVDMALTAASTLDPTSTPALVNLSIQAALAITAERPTIVQTLVAQRGENGARTVEILSQPPNTDVSVSASSTEWRRHVSAQIDLSAASMHERVDLDALRARFVQAGEPLEIDAFYTGYAALGLGYGPAFRSVCAVSRIASSGESLAQVAVEAAGAAEHVVHPALLDGCFQAVGAIFSDLDQDAAYLPVAIERVQVHAPLPATAWSHAVLRESAQPSRARVTVDLRLLDDGGRVLASVDGLQAVPVDRRALSLATADWKDKLYARNWVAQPRRAAGSSAQIGEGGWLVVADRGGLAQALMAMLQARGQHVVLVPADEAENMTRTDWTQTLATQLAPLRARGLPLHGVVHMASVDVSDPDDSQTSAQPPALAEAEARLCGGALALVQALAGSADARPPRLWFVTAGAQAVDEQGPANVVQALLWGFSRSVAIEHPALECTTIDLAPHEPHLPAEFVDELVAPEAEPQLAYRQGRRHVARLAAMKSFKRQRELVPPAGAFRLRAADYGGFDQLTLVGVERTAPAAQEVEIEVHAAAVNFKDVLFCLGMLRSFSERHGILKALDQPLGFECAGRVVRVGSAVTDLAVGDEVIAMALSAMASHVTVERRLVHRKPAALSFEAAASVPTVFMTAVYSLERLAHLRPGERVLIHACAGGVGQAALQVAQRAGAIVYGTASPSKWPVLKRQGVAHVMHSRHLDFADELMRVTEGRGVDVVINSLSGDFIEKSADALAPGGRFIEIGKIGIWSAERMAAYRPDIVYRSFDLGELDETGGGLQADLLGDVVRRFDTGELVPLPTRTFPITEADAAFRYLAQANNVGKVVLGVHGNRDRSVAQRAVRADRSYLVTGGLGALGRAVARRLVNEGARHLVLASRSGHDDELARAAEAELAPAQVHVWPLDVADSASVITTIERIGRELPPLGGIVHAAGLLDDATVANQSWEQFSRVLAPKVAGAWHLHRATHAIKLDFFVLFSSIASVFGAPGQANYAAANAFLDALAQQRRARGLTATSVNWGPWDTGGMAERTRAANEARFAAFGLERMTAADNLDVLGCLLGSDVAQTIVADVAWERFVRSLTHPSATALYTLVQGRAKTGSRATAQQGALRKRLGSAAPDARAALLTDALRSLVANVVGLASAETVDVSAPLRTLGIDSLMAVELKNKVEQALACALNPTLLIDHPSIAALVAHLIDTIASDAPASAPLALSPSPSSSTSNDTAAPATANALAGMQETMLELGERRLAVCLWTRHAQAPLAICVHGMLDQAATWAGVAGRLSEQGIAVLAPDLRSHGRSSHHPSHATLTVLDLLVDLTEVIAHEAPRRSIVLIGHSTGAVVSALYAALHPEYVAHLVTVEPIAPTLRDARDPLERLSVDLRYLTDAPAHPVYPDLPTAASMLSINHPKLPHDTALALACRITHGVPGGLGWIWDARLRNQFGVDLSFGHEEYLAILRTLTVPSTRIYGATSQFAGTTALLSPEVALPHSQTVSLDGGHNLHTDAPAELAQQIAAVFSTVTEG
ncbi:type I polyketide synthase [Trinickia fusca]|uniref:SDR family NAD(P)-dependent oxidoreductase n=1 Tax=Trinickia fusca TaxID=2419777 RepID=A0A494X3L0_9BURK|nr:type I polyketide synthase [Trinickia fusca]RKP45285.1 SDR family NAD(P)-dependent oxidoreductase [Trinickia fusca]